MKERDLKLKEKYPKILKNLGGDPRETCMAFGLEIGDGWIPLLEQCFKFCQFHHDKNGYPQLVADQIKEKFGTLRFYYHFEDCDSENAEYGIKFNRTEEMLEGACSFAEDMSSMICEQCGQPGTLHTKGWHYTACDECTGERNQRLEAMKQKSFDFNVLDSDFS